MTKQTEALRMAIKNMEQCDMGITVLLEGLAKFGVPKDILRLDKESVLVPAIKACKEALAETQEPVAWMVFDGEGHQLGHHKTSDMDIPLYTTPPSREWVGLSDEEIYETVGDGVSDIALAIEAKLKEKNG